MTEPPDTRKRAASGSDTGPTKQPAFRVRRLATILAIALAAGYLAVCVGLFLAQRHLIYFPSPHYGSTPGDVGLPYEDFTLTTDDGIALAAWYVPGERARPTILFCHGNGGNMSDLCSALKSLHRLGYSALIFDYRGYGRSAGQPSEAGLYRDAEAAWHHLVQVRGAPPSQIVLMGRSLGGPVAIDLAARHTPAALVVECTFASLVDIGQREYPLLPVSLLCRDRFESIRKLPQVTCPKLFLHGTSDELIPLEEARRLFAAAPEPKRFVETPGGHNDAGFEYNPEYVRLLGDWLESSLGK